MSDDPKPGAYRPFVAARRPGASPETPPRFRVVVHRKRAGLWAALEVEVGLQNAQRLWDHLAMRPDMPPLIGSVTPMKGGTYGPQSDGWSRVFHYEVSGAGRVDYRYNARHKTRPGGDEHSVVRIISIDLGSH